MILDRLIAFQLLMIGAITTPAQRPPDADWPIPAKNFQNTRFSNLDQIKIDNAKVVLPKL